MDAAQAQEQAVARQLERAEKRLEVGLGTRVEVDQTQAAYDNVVVALIRAQDAVADAQDSLSTLAERDIDDIAVLSPNYAMPQYPATRWNLLSKLPHKIASRFASLLSKQIWLGLN